MNRRPSARCSVSRRSVSRRSVSRRSVLRAGAAALAAAALPAWADQPQVFDTVILGAGISALHAARMLAQAGLSVAVLEVEGACEAAENAGIAILERLNKV